MGFLRRLLGGGSGQGGDKDGMYFYVRSNRTGEVIQLRLHRYNDLSQTDNEQGYFVRKLVVGQKGFDRMELEMNFDKNRRFVGADVQGGEMVDREDYDAYLAGQTGSPSSES